MHLLSAAGDSRTTNFRKLTEPGRHSNGLFFGQPILVITENSGPDDDPGIGRHLHLHHKPLLDLAAEIIIFEASALSIKSGSRLSLQPNNSSFKGAEIEVVDNVVGNLIFFGNQGGIE